MSLLLTSSTALLLLPLLTQIVTSDFPFNRKPQVTSVMVSMLKIQQVKERILRGLNMTAAPRMLTPDSSRLKVRKTMQDADRQPNVSMILSEACDDERTDTVSFKLNSKVRSQVQDIELAILVVMLRSNRDTTTRYVWHNGDHEEHFENLSKRKSAKEKQRKKNKRLGLSDYLVEESLEDARGDTNITSDVVGNSTRNKLKQKTFNGISTNFISSNSDGRSTQTATENGERMARQMRDLKSWRVKVVVKAIDPETGKRRRIAVEKLTVKRSSTMAVPLSKDVLIAAAASSNHTLQLQMTCKRCKGRVHIEKVYKTLRKKRKQLNTKLRLNPHRPYLFITTGSNVASPDFRNAMREAKPDSPNDIARARAKRRAIRSVSAEAHSSQNKTVKQVHTSYFSCCLENVEITFEELGVDVILYPKKVSINYCVSPCKSNYTNNVNTSIIDTRIQTTFKINYISSNIEKQNCTLKNAHNSSGSVNQVRSLHAVETTLLTEQGVDSPTARQLRDNCVLILVKPVHVIYLNSAHTITKTDLNDVMYLSCDCPGHR